MNRKKLVRRYRISVAILVREKESRYFFMANESCRLLAPLWPSCSLSVCEATNTEVTLQRMPYLACQRGQSVSLRSTILVNIFVVCGTVHRVSKCFHMWWQTAVSIPRKPSLFQDFSPPCHLCSEATIISFSFSEAFTDDGFLEKWCYQRICFPADSSLAKNSTDKSGLSLYIKTGLFTAAQSWAIIDAFMYISGQASSLRKQCFVL